MQYTMSKAPSHKLSPQTVVTPMYTAFTDPEPQFFEKEDEENDIPEFIFDWERKDATVFLQR